MDLSKKFLHRVDIIPLASQDAYGQTTYKTTVESVQCFVVGKQKRVLDNTGTEHQSDFEVYLLPTSPTTIGLGFEMQNAVNKFGTSIFTQGRVVGLEPVDKPKKGMQFYKSYIVVGE